MNVMDLELVTLVGGEQIWAHTAADCIIKPASIAAQPNSLGQVRDYFASLATDWPNGMDEETSREIGRHAAHLYLIRRARN